MPKESRLGSIVRVLIHNQTASLSRDISPCSTTVNPERRVSKHCLSSFVYPQNIEGITSTLRLCRRNHGPCSSVAAHFLEVVHDVEPHGRETIEITVAVHLRVLESDYERISQGR